MSKERIEDVAGMLQGSVSGLDRRAFVEILASLPEFQEPKSEWVKCSERMPDEFPHRKILATSLNDVFLIHTSNINCKLIPMFCLWSEVPEYNTPESELVRRFRVELGARHGDVQSLVECLKKVEKEIAANGK